MAITFSGLATGLDTDNIVKEIMALERAPLDRVEAKKAAATQRLAAFEQFKGKLDALKTAAGNMNLTSQLRSTKASVDAEAPFTATTTSGAIGTYDISVVQLSQVQKTITDGFVSNSESLLGSGSISINGTVINVSESNNSLLGLAASVNALSGTTGVKASIINDGTETSPYHLVFTGKDSSTSFTLTSSLYDDSEPTPLEIHLGETDVQEAQQAVAIIDGISVTSATNTISTAISGVTINLNAVDELAGVPPKYTSNKLNIEADTGAMKEKITTFVTAYNDAMEWILSGYEEFGGTSTVPEVAEGSDEEAILGSVLRGDATINSIKRQLQNVLTESIQNSGDFNILSEIGITTNLDGTLNQNNTKLDNALENNFDNMVYLLAGDDSTGGVMKNFNALLLKMTNGTNGMYAIQKSAYDNSLGRFQSQFDQMELRMTKREASLRSQFSAMETLVSSLNAQGDFLTQQMKALTGNN